MSSVPLLFLIKEERLFCLKGSGKFYRQTDIRNKIDFKGNVLNQDPSKYSKILISIKQNQIIYQSLEVDSCSTSTPVFIFVIERDAVNN